MVCDAKEGDGRCRYLVDVRHRHSIVLLFSELRTPALFPRGALSINDLIGELAGDDIAEKRVMMMLAGSYRGSGLEVKDMREHAHWLELLSTGNLGKVMGHKGPGKHGSILDP